MPTTSNRSPSPMDIDSGIERLQGESGLHGSSPHRFHPSYDLERSYDRLVEERTFFAMGPLRSAVSCSSRSAAAISPSLTINAARVLPANAVRSIAVPSKRPTEVYDRPGPGSLPPSPSALPQPAKRLHASASAPLTGRPPQPSRSDFGGELNPFIIAHDASVQAFFDAHKLAWGTIYEVARGVSKNAWLWSSVTRDKVEQLRGANVDAAHRVVAVMQGREAPRGPAAELWWVTFSLRLCHATWAHTARNVD